MNIITYYSQEPLSLHYSDEELFGKIGEYISTLAGIHFTYLQLCDYILSKADEEEKLGKKQNTIYLNPKLSSSDFTRISIVLWRMIMNGEICIDFYVNPYRGGIKDDTTFIIVRK